MTENEQIINNLADLIKKMPYQRFMQLLVNVGILEGPNDRYYEKSAETLARLQAAREALEL
jgi:hypothetical protein